MMKFLFFDDWTLESRQGFRRTVHPAKKHPGNPLVVPDRPWEGTTVHLYGTVAKDSRDGLFKMWYSTVPNIAKGDDRGILCLAVSRDGIHWRKPLLDVHKFKGRRTNIVLAPKHLTHGPTILIDEQEKNPARRYKLIMRPAYAKGIAAYASRDGIHWRRMKRGWVIPVAADMHVGCYRDRKTGKYTAYLRPAFGDRRVAFSESEDFIHWTRPALCLEPDQHDSPQTQFYGMPATQYGGYVVGMLSVFRTAESDMRWTKSAGFVDLELAYSRGGRCWHRAAQNKPILEMGGKTKWDGVQVYPSSTLVYVEDEIRLYYSGMPIGHDGAYTSARSCAGMASWRVDGFVSLDAAARKGSLLTRPFALLEPDIFLNADARKGEILVEVRNADGALVPGFELGNCVPIRGDSIRHRVRWRGRLDAIRRKPIRMRIVARNASLYSIWFPNGDKSPGYDNFREIGCVNPLKDLQEPEDRAYP